MNWIFQAFIDCYISKLYNTHSSWHPNGTFSKIHYVSGHKVSLNKYKNIKWFLFFVISMAQIRNQYLKCKLMEKEQHSGMMNRSSKMLGENEFIAEHMEYKEGSSKAEVHR